MFLYTLGFWIAIACLFWVYQINKRLKQVEAELKLHKGGLHSEVKAQVSEGMSAGASASTGTEAVPEPSFLPHQERASQQAPEHKYTQAQVAELKREYQKHHEPAFVTWMKEEWLMKLGALFLLIALGWFVSYAFANNWIGPMGRIIIGIIFGILVLALGSWRITKYKTQGSIFTVIGSGVIMLTIFAAREIYDFFTPASALIFMFFTNVFVTLQSLRFNHQGLAVAGLVLAAIAPALTAAPNPDVLGISLYVLVIISGFLWIVYLKGWSVITTLTLIIAAMYTLPYLSYNRHGGEEDIGLLFSFVFTTLIFGAHVATIVKRTTQSLSREHILVGLGLGGYLALWIVGAVSDEWQSLVLVLWSLLFAFGAFVVFALTKHREPFYVYLTVSLAYIAGATALELSGPALTIAYTIESLLLVGVAYHFLKDRNVARQISFVIVGPILLSFGSLFSSSWRSGVLNDDFFALLVVTISFFVLGALLSRSVKADGTPAEDHYVYYVIGGVYSAALIWLVTHAALPSYDFATTVSLVIYTIVGITLYFTGRSEGIKQLRVAGAVLLLGVSARLLLVDVWEMELAGRIITFFAIGVLLVATAFIGRKKDNSN